MDSKTFRLLEFPKVLALLSGLASSEAGAAACLEIGPLPPDRLADERELMREWFAWARESGFSIPEFPDISGLMEGVSRPGEILDIDDLATLLEVLQSAGHARESVSGADAALRPGLAEWIGGVGWPEKAFSALGRCISPDGLLKDQSSPELFAVREEIRGIHRKCTKRVKEFLSNENIQDYLQEEWMTISSDRYVLPVKTNFKGRVKGIIHDYSQTGETCYFEPLFLVELNNQLQELKREEREAEKKVLEYLTGLVRSERGQLAEVYDFMVRADVLTAKARFAEKAGAVPLEAVSGLPLRLRKVYHPLLLARVKDARDRPAGDKAEPVDIELGQGQRVLVISGGNAGGKTVALKTLGLSALMAASNVPVPAAEGSTLPFWRDIRVLLGDQQSIEDSLSTFTAQIDSLTSAWDSIDDQVLVIMDEFGAGTDPSQGAALAQAVLDGLLEKGAWAALATHFPALKAHALATAGIRSASVLFDPETRKPLFKLAYDMAGESQALNVARERGMPAEILERAEKYLLLDGPGTGGVMDRLNELALNRERELERIKEERGRLEVKRRKLEQVFEREKEALLGDVKAKAQCIVREWREGRLSRKKALKELSEARERIVAHGVCAAEAQEQAPAALDLESAKPGLSARYPVFGKVGVVRERDEKRGLVKFDMDGVAMWVRPEDLEPCDERPRETRAATGNVSSSLPGLSLDLRGFRADEARSELMKFLDRAILAGHQHLEVVHGKGTGALRREVRDVLERSPMVSNFELAPEDSGGDGMTKVELK